MFLRCHTLSLIGAVLGWASIATAAHVQVCFWSESRLHMVQREVGGETATAEAALAALAAGPTDQERAAGITSALPAGTTVERITTDGDTVTVDFGQGLLAGPLDESWLEAVYRQVSWTLHPLETGQHIRLTVAGVPLSDYLPAAPDIQPAPPGKTTATEPAQAMMAAGSALAGRKIALSPGHGLRWSGSTWNYERPVYCAPLNNEDLHNVELVALLDAYLAQDGANDKKYRCLDKNFGNYASGKPWWTMSAAYWIKQLGYPCTVYASSTGDCTLGSGSDESSDSLRSRPLASDYDNTDIYISMHTNGYQGDCAGSGCPNGTCTYYDAGTEHAPWGAISQDLAQKVNTSIVNSIRNSYPDSTWQNRGALNSNGAYGEIRIPDRAAVLVELAFHDSCDRDAVYLRDPFFQSLTMWAVYKGVCDYFGTSPTYGLYSDEYVSDTIPSEMLPGQSYDVSITFRNRGVLWTSARQFRLGAVGDYDPFTAFNRVSLSSDVGPGQTYTFEFTMTAPTTPGTYTTDWQMVRDGVAWFGVTHSEQVTIGREFAQADFDFDHDVDMEDFGHFQACLSGVGVLQTDPNCQDANFDHDSDVDEIDFAVFQACFRGPNIEADPYCGS